MKKLKEEDLPPSDGVWNYYSGYHRWESRLNGHIHNSLGPAVIQFTQQGAIYQRAWVVNHQYHRLDGPAIEYADGTKKWYANGELHRLDGPAFECADGYEEWYVGGVECPAAAFPRTVIKHILNIDEQVAEELEAALKKNA